MHLAGFPGVESVAPAPLLPARSQTSPAFLPDSSSFASASTLYNGSFGSSAGDIAIHIKTPHLRTVSVNQNATVHRLKSILSGLTAVATNRQELRLGGRMLADNELVGTLQTTPHMCVDMREIPGTIKAIPGPRLGASCGGLLLGSAGRQLLAPAEAPPQPTPAPPAPVTLQPPPPSPHTARAQPLVVAVSPRSLLPDSRPTSSTSSSTPLAKDALLMGGSFGSGLLAGSESLQHTVAQHPGQAAPVSPQGGSTPRLTSPSHSPSHGRERGDRGPLSVSVGSSQEAVGLVSPQSGAMAGTPQGSAHMSMLQQLGSALQSDSCPTVPPTPPQGVVEKPNLQLSYGSSQPLTRLVRLESDVHRLPSDVLSATSHVVRSDTASSGPSGGGQSFRDMLKGDEASKRRTTPLGSSPLGLVPPKAAPEGQAVQQKQQRRAPLMRAQSANALDGRGLMRSWMRAGRKEMPAFAGHPSTTSCVGGVGWFTGFQAGVLTHSSLDGSRTSRAECGRVVSLHGDGDLVVAALPDGLCCYDLRAGSWLWKEGGEASLVAVRGGNLLVGSNIDLHLADTRSYPEESVSLGEPAGSNKWMHVAVDERFAAAIDTGNNFFVWCTKGEDRASIVGQHSGNHGKKLWCSTPDESVTKLFLCDGLVCVVKGGKFCTRNTIQLWEADTGNCVQTMAVDASHMCVDVLCVEGEVLVAICEAASLHLVHIDRASCTPLNTTQLRVPPSAGRCLGLKFAGIRSLISTHDTSVLHWSPLLPALSAEISVPPASVAATPQPASAPSPKGDKCCIM